MYKQMGSSMYAVFQSGGKQYRISKNQIVRLEKLARKEGEFIEFSKVLMISNNREIKIGAPYIDGSVIKAKIISHGRERKVKIIKFRRRKHYRKHHGHRQWFTDIKITDIMIKDQGEI